MGYPVSPVTANMYMEYFQDVALRTADRLQRGFVDNTFVTQQLEHKENFLKHIYSTDQYIKFTKEDIWPDGSMPFMDTVVTLEPNRTLSRSAHRKPTHTDQYLHWDSHHHISAKYSVINTLHHRARKVSSMPEMFRTEKTTCKGSINQMCIPCLDIK